MSVVGSNGGKITAAGLACGLGWAIALPLWGWGQLPGGAEPHSRARVEQLVPAAMGIRTDKLGNAWNIEQNGNLGRVGSNMMVNSGLNLYINNEQFYTYQPMMTADGSEYVLHNRQSSNMMGLQVIRRIQLVEKKGVVRYLEIMTNTTTNPLTVNVSLRTNFSGNYKSYITDEGHSNTVMLGDRESGVVVMPESSQVNRAFIFSLCSEKSTLKPSISSQNKYGLSFQYNVSFAPGQTVVLAHAVGQIPLPDSFNRKAMRRLFRPLSLDQLLSSIPGPLRKLLANYKGTTAPGAAVLVEGSHVDDLGVDRSARDTLALGADTRLLGTASCASLKIKTVYGEAGIPFEDVAALVGGNRGRRDVSRIFLRDGQVFSGEVEARGLRFLMAGGGSMNLNVDNLDRLVLKKGGDDGKWGADAVATVETYGGDRLALADAEGFGFSAMTPWGKLDFVMDDILWLAPLEGEPVGHYVEFKSGARNFVYLVGDQVAMESLVFGHQDLKMHEVRTVVTRAAVERGADGEAMAGEGLAIQEPYLNVGDDQRIVGKVGNPQLRVLSQAETVEIAADEIRRMKNISEGHESDGSGDPVFRIELWGGGVVAGYLAGNFLSVRVRGEDWQVPLRDVREFVTPVPKLSETARQDLSSLIRKLGSVEWPVREKATEDLVGFGYLAKPLLEQEHQSNTDPEVRRRIERVLARIGG